MVVKVQYDDFIFYHFHTNYRGLIGDGCIESKQTAATASRMRGKPVTDVFVPQDQLDITNCPIWFQVAIEQMRDAFDTKVIHANSNRGNFGRLSKWKKGEYGYFIQRDAVAGPEQVAIVESELRHHLPHNPNFLPDELEPITPGRSRYAVAFSAGPVDCVVKLPKPEIEQVTTLESPFRKVRALVQEGLVSPIKRGARIAANLMDRYDKIKEPAEYSKRLRPADFEGRDYNKRIKSEQPIIESQAPTIDPLDRIIHPPARRKLTRKRDLKKADIAAVSREKAVQGPARIPTQNDIFKCPANDAAAILGLPRKILVDGVWIPVDYNWTHLFAHQFEGNEAQTSENIVLATTHCNSLMMLLERLIAEYVGEKNLTAHIDIECVVNPDDYGFNCAEYILYKVNFSSPGNPSSEPRKPLVFEFDPRLLFAPPADAQAAMRAVIECHLKGITVTQQLPVRGQIETPVSSRVSKSHTMYVSEPGQEASLTPQGRRVGRVAAQRTEQASPTLSPNVAVFSSSSTLNSPIRCGRLFSPPPIKKQYAAPACVATMLVHNG